MSMAGFNLSNVLRLGRQFGICSILPTRQVSVGAGETSRKPKTGIVMLNMGGPSTLSEVPEYLLRIMTDSDIIKLPFQSVMGPWIAKRRVQKVQDRYKQIGGGSPILSWTNKQGELLCKELDNLSPDTAPHKHYVAFRYANPTTEAALQKLEEDNVENAIIFSQYPQYCCGTSGSSYNTIYKYYQNRNFPSNMKWSIIDRWATNPLFIKSVVARINEELVQFPPEIRDDVLILFSAHSLPLKAVLNGDSYPAEVGATVSLVMQELNFRYAYQLVWQSKVGPVSWLEPTTYDAMRSYVKQGKKNFLLVPIAFVNEHIETLHEMDIEFCKDAAKEFGIENIRRSAAPNDHPVFISALADIVASHIKSQQPLSPKFLTRCPRCMNNNCRESKAWFAKVCNGATATV